jgi:uncharacterized protein (DUF2236 family)
VSARAGYFSNDSAVRRIGCEAVLMLGGGRALLMQAAHPLVAAGIVSHSRYRDEPWRRLARTMVALYTIVFGTRAEARRAGAGVRAVHARVHGRLTRGVGPFPAGTPYAADDPELMLWVHSTLVDTGIVMHEAFVGRLTDEDRNGFYDDMRLVARLFGVPAGVVPPTLTEFTAYQRRMLASTTLCVGDDAHAVAAAVLHPPAPLPLRPTVMTAGRASVALVPDAIRDHYGLRSSALEQAAIHATAVMVRALVLPRLPARLRLLTDDGRRHAPWQLLTAFAR